MRLSGSKAWSILSAFSLSLLSHYSSPASNHGVSQFGLFFCSSFFWYVVKLFVIRVLEKHTKPPERYAIVDIHIRNVLYYY